MKKSFLNYVTYALAFIGAALLGTAFQFALTHPFMVGWNGDWAPAVEVLVGLALLAGVVIARSRLSGSGIIVKERHASRRDIAVAVLSYASSVSRYVGLAVALGGFVFFITYVRAGHDGAHFFVIMAFGIGLHLAANLSLRATGGDPDAPEKSDIIVSPSDDEDDRS